MDSVNDPVDFHGKRIFITGGTGYLGSLILRRLKEQGAAATVLTRDPKRFRAARPELIWPELTFLTGDIQSFHFAATTPFDYLIHGGNPADLPADAEGQVRFRKTTVEGTAHLLDQLARLSAPPARVLLLSSGAVYGKVPDPYTPFREDALPLPIDEYGAAKLETEAQFTAFARQHGTGLGIARIFACAGRYIPLAGRFALGQFIAAARSTGIIEIRSDGTPRRSYLEGDELADWILTLLRGRADQEKAVETLNVGSDDALTIREIAETVRAVFAERGKTVDLRFASAEPGRPVSPSYLPNVSRIAEKYGLKPKKSSTQAVREATEWALDEA